MLLYLFFSLVFIFASITVISQFDPGQTAAAYLPLVIPFSIAAFVAVVIGWLCGRIFENLPFRALGCGFTSGWFKHFAVGCLIGAVAFGSSLIVAIMSGGISLTLNRESQAPAIGSTLAITFVILLIGAASEETLFRGYLLQTFTRAKLIWFSVGLTSALFAFAHNGNPDAGKLSLLNTFLAGIWFAAAYLKTRDIWFPFGIHVVWNWLQGPVFGINISGLSGFAPDPVFRATDAGPVWLTGGSYGIEGGVACTFAIVIAIGLVYFIPGLKPSDDMLRLTSEEQATIAAD
jgi:membrane protease YdiL (CAAX protease family)